MSGGDCAADTDFAGFQMVLCGDGPGARARQGHLSGEECELWDAESGQPLGPPLRGHDAPVTSVAFSPDGKRLASASEGHTVWLSDVEAQSWLKRACAIANRDLTHEEWRSIWAIWLA